MPTPTKTQSRSITPVLAAIRKLVKRPKVSEFKIGDDSLRCPLGMLPSVKCALPIDATDFEKAPGTSSQIRAFYIKWDSFTDIQKAIDWCWGKVATKPTKPTAKRSKHASK